MEEKDEPIQEDDQVVGIIQNYMKQKWYTEVMYRFIDGSYFQHITLIDYGADVNCIREGIIPHKYFCKAAHRIRGADGGLLTVEYQIPEIYICISEVCIKTSFLLVKNLKQDVILGTPFLSLIRPFLVRNEDIQFEIMGKQVSLRFSSNTDEILDQLVQTKREQVVNTIYLHDNSFPSYLPKSMDLLGKTSWEDRYLLKATKDFEYICREMASQKSEWLTNMSSWRLPQLPRGHGERFNHNFRITELQQGLLNLLWQTKNKKEKAHALNGLAYYFKNFVPSDQKITEKRAKIQDIPHHEERLLDYREEKSRDGQDKLPMEVEQSMATDKNTKVFSDKILISTDPASSMVAFYININNLLQSFPHNKPSSSTKRHDTIPQTPYILHNHPNSFLPQYILRTQPKAPCRSCAYKDSCQKKLKSQNPMSTTYENLQPRLSFKTEQTLSCFGQDILDLVWQKFKERQMKIFLGLQDYFFDLLEGRERNPAIRVIIYMLPLLRLDNQAISDPSYRFLVLKAEINLQRFRNLPTYNHEEISLQTIIDHGLVNSIYATLDQILQSDLGNAVKDVCRRLGHGRYRIIFSSIPPKFTPPVRPAIHYIYIMKGQFNFQEDGPSKLSDEEEEIYTTIANHENWRLFSEAAEIEEAITTDYEYQLVFQNKITRIFISKFYNQSYEYFKGAGRIIKPDFGNECSKKSYYRSLAQWFQKTEPSEIDTVQSAPMIINEDNE